MSKYLSIDSIVKKNDGSEYKILEILGIGANTVTYLTECKNNNGIINKRILKEYCPSYLNIERDEMNNISTENIDKFLKGKEMFIKGGANQNELRSKIELTNQTPPLLDIFETNNTVYLDVVPFVGKTLNKVNDLSFVELLKLSITITKLVKQYHKLGYLCLDIKPDNIYILYNDDEVVTDMVEFIDLDSVRSKESIGFGTSLSFTTSWAAPEQLNIFSYLKISERTDVYTIGELIFYLIFGRHSTIEEHRTFSKFNFSGKSEYATYLERPAIQKQLTYLFKNTLRSSTKNRFSNVDEIIICLNQILDISSKDEFIIPYKFKPKGFFIGRENEIEDIDYCLKNDNILFITGTAGIGKSELVKNYISLYDSKYDNILYFSYETDIISMIVSNRTVSISNFIKEKEESEEQFFERKINKLAELTTNNTLIFIDNFDVLLENIEDKNQWKKLLKINGKFIITSRCVQSDYKNYHLKSIFSNDALLDIFKINYFSWKENDLEYMKEIISYLGGNTLLIELIAKLIVSSHITPKEMYENLINNINDALEKENVSLLKDDEINSASVINHLISILSISELNKDSLTILFELALMPNDGIMLNDFKNIYDLENFNLINDMINSGWISKKECDEEILYIHSIISSVIIKYVCKHHSNIINVCCFKGFECIRRKHNDISLENYVLYRKALVAKLFTHEITNSYALKIMLWFDTFFNDNKFKYNLLNFAIKNYSRLYSHDKYSAVLEKGYIQIADCMIRDGKYDEVINLCKEHIKKCKRAKDDINRALWMIKCSKTMLHKDIDNFGSLYYYDSLVFLNLKIGDIYPREKHKTKNIEKLEYLDYPSEVIEYQLEKEYINLWLNTASIIERIAKDNIYYEKGSWYKKTLLKKALKIRSWFRSEVNKANISLDKAILFYLEKNYNECVTELLQTVKIIEANIIFSDSFKLAIIEFLARTYMLINDFANAKVYYDKCLEITKTVNYDCNHILSEYGLVLNLNDLVDKAIEFNNTLLLNLEKMDNSIRKHYLAKVYYNLSYSFYLKGEYKFAREYLTKAFNELKNEFIDEKIKTLINARCYSLLGDIRIKDPKSKTPESAFDCALANYDIYLGLEYPEAIICKEKMLKLLK